MQVGDLADGPLADVLRGLAADRATGGLHVQRDDSPAARDAVLYLRDGRLYAATSPGPRPLLGVRLVSAGAVTREALEEALASQAGELAGWRLGELLVHLGYVDAEIVTEFVIEQILDTVAEVSSWPAGGWRFRRGERTRDADDLALDIDAVLDHVLQRRSHLSTLAAAGSADAVPARVSYDPELAAAQIPLAQTLLREIDGTRTLAELAARCGLTTFEAGQVLALLTDAGAIEIHEPDPAAASAAPAAGGGEQTADDDLSALFAGDEDDLGVQLAILARQAEEARFAAEARRHDEITARRRAANAAADCVSPRTAPDDRTQAPVPDPAPDVVVPAAAGETPDTHEPETVPSGPDVPARPLTVDVRDLPDGPVLADGLPDFPVVDDMPDFPVADGVPDLPVVDDMRDLPVAYDHLEALAAAVAPDAPDGPTPFAPLREVVPESQAYDDAAEGGIAALRDLAAAGFTLPEADEEPGPDELSAPDDRYALTDTLADTAGALGAYEPDYAVSEPAAEAAGNPFVDSAALLRELSSLGLDDVPVQRATSRSAPPAGRPAPPVAAAGKSKRKSIFGR